MTFKSGSERTDGDFSLSLTAWMGSSLDISLLMAHRRLCAMAPGARAVK